MAESHVSLAPWRVDHLLLLVGENPLPNAVVGTLLVVPGGLITLVHSNDTARAAQKLRSWFERHDVVKSNQVKVDNAEIKEAHPASIMRGVHERLKKRQAASVGLHYTGGTKAMAVHAYRMVEQWGKERDIKPVFSYLDARPLCLIVDPDQEIYIGRAVPFSLRDLIRLHGWTLLHNNLQPVSHDFALT